MKIYIHRKSISIGESNMKIVEPKCPKCGNTKLAYKRIPSTSKIRHLIKNVSVNEEKMNSAKREEDKKRYENSLVDYRKQLDDVFVANLSHRDGEASIIFCIKCGEIIGTGGGVFQVEDIR